MNSSYSYFNLKYELIKDGAKGQTINVTTIQMCSIGFCAILFLWGGKKKDFFVITITRFVLKIKLNSQSDALPGVDSKIERKLSSRLCCSNTFVKASLICIRCSVD